MGHQKRVWYPGAKYHIICRGNKKQNIFLDAVDHLIYLDIIKEVKARHDYSILTYCLMPNHVHLQIKTKDIEIWRIMREVNWRYARYFNERYNTVGHVFQGRYGSKIIENNYYNLVVNRYIHLNPVKDKLTLKPGDYRWSSYSIYLGEEKSELVDEGEILSYFDGKRSLYNKFIMSFV
ncbi:REP element-mobilizing transposase RayT [Halanaerobium saccharolyticum]|uniref:REP element-mobilizing transposase RayT n=1 Tax=Halanaerobium saccharolyticum TaxID=43595 RepID=A0A4R7YZC2_9FIRM|nr:transposase [Halanaerobium saccharolyticum]RAK07484.1 REP element-mobilizing transposase RayT [Halanaerobium saccharolyticum]TDW03061.1 REP element-mobilizing transposase RayT [Halanaerobium saccharolyticum]TDX59357.1 REP element-mobilizing transposase RayT [Halanaerobium saccharolyticum]